MSSFQEAGVIRWKLHFRSPPEKVYQALATDEGRKSYWAESAKECNGELHYVFLNEIENRGRILEREPNRCFVVEYFGWHVTFDLAADAEIGGTDFTMTCRGVEEADLAEITAGWVSWLLTMKAAVDFGVDLRNHNHKRSWFTGYADN